MKKRSIVAYGHELPESLLKLLGKEFDVVHFQCPDKQDTAAFAQATERASGLIGVGVELGPELLDRAERLEIVASISDGYDAYDLSYFTKRGILLTNTPGVETEAVADAGFALLLAAARRIVEGSLDIKKGLWMHGFDGTLSGTDVHGKRLGVIGFGQIGQAIAHRGHFGFGMSILYWDRAPMDEAIKFETRFMELDALLAEADFICVTVPLSAGTYHLLGGREFARMQAHAIFINISRGKVVDENALIASLKLGHPGAAALDVFETEPLPVDSPLIGMSNVVTTPHIGAATLQTYHAMAELAVQNLLAGLRGDRPANLVNTSVMKNRANVS